MPQSNQSFIKPLRTPHPILAYNSQKNCQLYHEPWPKNIVFRINQSFPCVSFSRFLLHKESLLLAGGSYSRGAKQGPFSSPNLLVDAALPGSSLLTSLNGNGFCLVRIWV